MSSLKGIGRPRIMVILFAPISSLSLSPPANPFQYCSVGIRINSVLALSAYIRSLSTFGESDRRFYENGVKIRTSFQCKVREMCCGKLRSQSSFWCCISVADTKQNGTEEVLKLEGRKGRNSCGSSLPSSLAWRLPAPLLRCVCAAAAPSRLFNFVSSLTTSLPCHSRSEELHVSFLCLPYFLSNLNIIIT